MTDTTSAAPVAWRVHPFDYGIGHEGVYAMTMLEQQRDAWLRKGWKVEPLYVAPPAVVEPPELSPDFTDTARAALLWVLWHHQGGSSPVGQPIRFALGMGQHDRLNEHQLAEAKRWERLHPANPAVFPRGPEPLTDGLLQQHNRDSQELRRLCAARDQARSERDALKAEIAGLESSCSTLGRLVDELRADSERLEWVLRRCAGSWLRSYLGVVSDTGDMDTLRTLIDANRGALTARVQELERERAVAAEREACAKLVQDMSHHRRWVRAGINGEPIRPCEYAAAIRARGAQGESNG